MKVFKYNKKIVSILLFIFLNLSAFKFLPTVGRFQGIVALGIFFVVIPLIYSKFILKNNLTVFRLKIGDIKKGIVLSGISLAISLLILYVVFNYTGFADRYTLPMRVVSDFSYFMYYELVVVLFTSLVYEFFFRGFLMFHLVDDWGWGAILFQWLVFLILVGLNTQFSWGMVPYMIFFPFAGWIAYESKSLFYSLATQSIFIIITDIVLIKTNFLN
ncbi:MAG: hypothetical protein ACD_12C00617G0003 [uncultured bacterium]|nr:MAG: hypothetical protein ACD_12C00617G0003 [uncultured bacterium]